MAPNYLYSVALKNKQKHNIYTLPLLVCIDRSPLLFVAGWSSFHAHRGGMGARLVLNYMYPACRLSPLVLVMLRAWSVLQACCHSMLA